MMTYPLLRDPDADGIPVRLTAGSAIPPGRTRPDGLARQPANLDDAHLINALIDA